MNLDDVDTDDGEKIVSHVFGSNSDQVAQTLGGNLGGAGGDLVKRLLPILAPIVLSYLTERLRGGGQDQAAGGGGLQDILGSILGGMSGTGSGSSGGSVMDVLGGLLGGGRR